MDQYIGVKLDGRYEIRENVGIGGMANVYKAYDLIEDRIVAVKLLKEEYLSDEECIRRFKNESKAIAVLSHPNIVKVYDVIFSEKMQVIVMEYIDGITLKEYIDQRGVLRWKEAVHYTIQILRALQHAHDRGIVHRDIKPHNIMLLSDGTIKVTDFGIARFARSDSRTLSDKAIGSVHYISPEQAQGGVIDDKTDIYSVGIMMFEMLTGKLPFEADSPVSVAIKQIQSQAERPRSINPEIPEGLEEITLRAMEKEPANRYQSAADMLQDLNEFKMDPTLRFYYQERKEAAEKAAQKEDTRKTSTAEQPPERTSQKEKRKLRFEKREEPEPEPEQEELEDEEEDDDDEPRGGFRLMPVLSGVAGAFVVVTIGLLLTLVYLNNPFERVEELPIPNLVGMNYESLVNSDEYPFDIQIDGEPTYHDQYGKGVIYEQLPKEGKYVKVGGLVKVKVSSGTKMVTVPAFVNQEVTEAYNILNDMGLRYTTSGVNDDSVPKGYVIRTVPDQGTSVPAGTEVTVYVSVGSDQKMVTVPSITGLSPENARIVLENYGLEIGNITDMASKDVAAGLIIAQNPAENSQVLEGTKIDINVSKGDEEAITRTLPVPMPDLDKLVTLQATQDGVERHQETLNPSEVKKWRISFDGSGTSRIKVLIDGELYMELILDFENNQFSRVVDNSDNFQ